MAGIFEWIYNSNTGSVNELPVPVAELQLRSGLGWHGPFETKAETLAYYTANKPANPGWKAPAGVKDLVPNAVDSAGDAAKKAADSLNPFKGVNIQSVMIRISEILIGIVLLGVGIAKLTGTTNQISKLAKVAL